MMWNVPNVLLLMQYGGALDWAHKKRLKDQHAVDEVQSLTAQKIENLEADRMKFSAFRESVRKFPFG